MTKTCDTQTAHSKPDGILTTQTGNQTIITEIYFNPDSRETFQDKLIKAVSADRMDEYRDVSLS